MAKPDLTDGFFQLAYELLASLVDTPAMVGLRGKVLWEVFAQIYGQAKLPAALLSPSEIAGRSGDDPANVSRAIRDLVGFGVLSRGQDGSYRFVKDYESWRFPGETDVRRARRLAYAGHAPTLAKSHLSRVSELTTHKRSSRVRTDTITMSKLTRSRVRTDTILAPPYVPPSMKDNLRLDSVCIGETHTHNGNEVESDLTSQPCRTAEDLDGVLEAARILAGNLSTEHLSQRLLQSHNLPDLLPLEGWRWVLAANRQLSSKLTHSKRLSWPYLVAVARNLTEADRDEVTASPAPLADAAVNGHGLAVERTLTKSQLRDRRQRAELEALHARFNGLESQS